MQYKYKSAPFMQCNTLCAINYFLLLLFWGKEPTNCGDSMVPDKWKFWNFSNIPSFPCQILSFSKTCSHRYYTLTNASPAYKNVCMNFFYTATEAAQGQKTKTTKKPAKRCSDKRQKTERPERSISGGGVLILSP